MAARKKWRTALPIDDPRTSPPPKDAVEWNGWKMVDRDKSPAERQQATVKARSWFKARELVAAELGVATDAVECVLAGLP